MQGKLSWFENQIVTMLTIVYLFTGKITATNVLSDWYAYGVTECVLILVGLSTKM